MPNTPSLDVVQQPNIYYTTGLLIQNTSQEVPIRVYLYLPAPINTNTHLGLPNIL